MNSLRDSSIFEGNNSVRKQVFINNAHECKKIYFVY